VKCWANRTAVALAVSVLSGCAATHGVLGGGYQREIDRREAEVADLARERGELETQLQDTQQQRAAVLKEESKLRQRLWQLRDSLQNSRQIIDAESQRKSIDAEQLEQLNREQRRLDLELTAMRLRLSEVERSADAAQLNSIEADLSSMEERNASHEALMRRYLEGK
jgi:chromosome segregation ATPase